MSGDCGAAEHVPAVAAHEMVRADDHILAVGRPKPGETLTRLLELPGEFQVVLAFSVAFAEDGPVRLVVGDGARVREATSTVLERVAVDRQGPGDHDPGGEHCCRG